MAIKSKKTKSKQVRVTSAHIAEVRANKGKDLSPTWEGAASWTGEAFHARYREAMQYYNLEFSAKDLKPAVLKWMSGAGYSKPELNLFKNSKDWRCGATMGAIASCLLRGMPPTHAGFNKGKSTEDWLRSKIAEVLANGSDDLEVDSKIEKSATLQTVQDRVREVAYSMTEEIEDAFEQFSKDPEKFDPKGIKLISVFRNKQTKAAHARIIKDLYVGSHNELLELSSGRGDEQLREGYSHLPRKYVKKLIEFYSEISSACDMILQEAKIVRKPRAKKEVSKDKLVEKLKYKKVDETLKLVSINPTEIIGAKELWCFDTKTRKIIKYVAKDTETLTVKGTSILGFEETKSISKTLRKPAEQLAAFKAAGKVALRKFMDEINAVEIKATGRINEYQILLRTG